MPKQMEGLGRVVIRRLQPGDAPALAEFYGSLSAASKRTFAPLGRAPTLAACEEVAQDNRPEIDRRLDLVALDGRRIVGWGFVWLLNPQEPMFGLGVADDYQGQGLGSRLIDRVLEGARARGLERVFLTVVKDNARALHLYESRGFVIYGELVDDGLDFWRMAVALPRASAPAAEY